MAQLLAGGVIALGVLILVLTFFLGRRQRKATKAHLVQLPQTDQSTQLSQPGQFEQPVEATQTTPISSPVEATQATATADASASTVDAVDATPVSSGMDVSQTPPVIEQAVNSTEVVEHEASTSTDTAMTVEFPQSIEVALSRSDVQQPLWWRDQLQSLTSQLQYLREHAKDVERQIAILSEIAALVTELEMLQKKREISPEGKISIFPLHVHRQPTELSYTTDKRPTVRKYTIEALS